MNKIRDISNKIFNRLTVAWPAGKTKDNKIVWLCFCSCGNFTTSVSGDLLSGRKQSCGCLHHEKAMQNGKKRYRHGHAIHTNVTPEYRAYHSAKTRCTNVHDWHYKTYGGRGVEFRFKSFEDFKNAVGLRPSSEYSLDRIDNNGHYESGNIRWATAKEQRINQRPKFAIASFNRDEFETEAVRRGYKLVK